LIFLKAGQMNENEMMQNDEISLFDLWGKLRDGWRYVVGGTLIGLVGAGAAIALIPPKYEAVAVIQVGQVGQLGQLGQVGQAGQTSSVPVEPATQAVERMKSPAFQMKVAKAAGVQEWVDALLRSTGATTKYLALQIVKATATPGPGGAPLIELRASAESAEVARKIAEATIGELAKRQLELARPTVEKMRLDLMIAKDNLASAEKELENIHRLVANVGVKDDRFSQLSLMTNLRVSKELEFFKQRQVIAALETALAVPYTQPAEVLEDIFVTDRPVSPRKKLLLALGLVGGMLAGVVLVFFVDAWRRARRERAGRTSA
jgi:uncharacterized protein involved in exopolysaccharide biosynthesis